MTKPCLGMENSALSGDSQDGLREGTCPQQRSFCPLTNKNDPSTWRSQLPSPVQPPVSLLFQNRWAILGLFYFVLNTALILTRPQLVGENFNPGEISHPCRLPDGDCSSLLCQCWGCYRLWNFGEQWGCRSPAGGAFLPWGQAEPLPWAAGQAAFPFLSRKSH